MKVTRKRQLWLYRLAFAVLLVMSLTSLALWHIHSVQFVSIHESGLTSLLQPGDAVIVKTVKFSTLATGDVVVHHDPVHFSKLQAHRVIAINVVQGTLLTERSSGQVNPTMDASLVVGKATSAWPKLGYALDFIRSPRGLIILAYLPAAIITWQELRNLFIFYRARAYRLLAYRYA